MHRSGIRFYILLVILAGIAITGTISTLSYPWAQSITGVSAAIAIAAIAISLYRTGFQGYTFWITLIAAYPVITPFIVVQVLGFTYFSGRAQDLQAPETMSVPLLLASLATLFFSLAINSRLIRIPRTEVSEGVSAARPRLTWLVLGSITVLAFAWLTEPGPPVWRASYADLMTFRIPGTNFAGAAWAVASCINLSIYLALRRCSFRNIRRLSAFLFWAASLLSILYLLAHARRSEVAGYIILLFCVFGPATRNFVKILLVVSALVSLSAIGYLRESTALADYLASEYIHLPGGAGNILIGYIVAFNLVGSGDLALTPGTTYAGHILRLPPSVLGLERPPTAYEHVHDSIPLSGGEYFLIEPLLNFGVTGVIVYLIGFVVLTNWSISVIRKYVIQPNSVGKFVVAGTFLALEFRTLWYGAGAVIKALIIAAGLAFLVHLAVRVVMRWRARQYTALTTQS